MRGSRPGTPSCCSSVAAIAEQLVRRALLQDAALVHEDGAVGDFAGEADLVGDDDHRHVHLAGQRLHDVEHFADEFGVERGCRLVEQHELRLHGERAGDGDALLLAAGELRGVGVDFVGEADAVEQLAAEPPRRLRGHPLHVAAARR